MKSFIAALRTLTLPFGAGPNDERIVLNGVSGRIEIYRAGGLLLMTLDDNGLQVFDSDGDLRQSLGEITDFSAIRFLDTAGLNSGFLTYGAVPGSNDYRMMSLQGPNTDLDLSRLIILTPKGSITKNPLFQRDTGLLDATVAVPIVDLTGFSRGDSRAAITVVDELKRGSNNGGGNAPTQGNSYPRGSMGKEIGR